MDRHKRVSWICLEFLGTALLFTVGCATQSSLRTLDSLPKAIGGNNTFDALAAELLAGLDGDFDVACAPFTHKPQDEVTRASQYVGSKITVSMRRVSGGELNVFTREYLEDVLSDQKRSASHLYTAEDAPRVGKLIAATHLVVGEIWLTENRLRVVGRILNIETGEVANVAETSVLVDESEATFLEGERRARTSAQPIQEIVAQDARTADWIDKGFLFVEQDEFGVALLWFDRALEINPKEPAAWFGWASACNALGQHDDAIAGYTKVIELRSRSKCANAYNNRGNAWFFKAEYARAIDDTNRAIDIDDGEASYYRNRGVSLHQLGRYNDAIEDFGRAIELDSNDSNAYHNRAISLELLGDYDRAIEDANKAIERGSQFAYVTRGNIWEKKGEYDYALEDFDASIKLGFNLARAWAGRGVLWSHKGDIDRAIKAYTTAIGIEPFSKVYENRGIAFEEKGDSERAIEDYTAAIRLNSKACEAYLRRGFAWADKGHYDRAIEDFTMVIELNSEDSLGYLNRAYMWVKKHDDKRATDDYTAAIKRDPGHADTYFNRAVAYTRLGDEDRAIIDFTKCLEIDPKVVECYSGRGQSWLRKGEYERAIQELTEAIALDPSLSNAFYNRGSAWSAMGEKTKAIEDYEKYLTLDAHSEWADRARQFIEELKQ